MVLGLTLGSLYIEAKGCVPVLLENLHGTRLLPGTLGNFPGCL